MAGPINPLEHPILFSVPKRLLAFSPAHEKIPLAMLLVDLLRPRTIVELGTYYGETYCAFCQAAQELGLTARAFGFGTWLRDPDRDPHGKLVLADLSAHHNALYSSFSQLREIEASVAEVELGESSVDLLHVIGSRSLAAPLDLAFWLPKLSNRGVLWLEMVPSSERDQSLEAFRAKLDIRYEHFSAGDHDWSTLYCVGREVPDSLRSLATSLGGRGLGHFLSFLAESRGEEQRARALTAKALKQQAAIVKLQLRLEGLVREKTALEQERAWLREVLNQMRTTRLWRIGDLYWRIHARLASRVRGEGGRVDGMQPDQAPGSAPAVSRHAEESLATPGEAASALPEGVRSIGSPVLDDLSLLISESEIRLGRTPNFLDWNTGINIASEINAPIATYSSTLPLLPHIDHSIDIVLLANSEERWVAEAKRVARLAVVQLGRKEQLTDRQIPSGLGLKLSSVGHIEWLQSYSSPTAPAISILFEAGRRSALEERLPALVETLTRDFEGELVIIGPSGSEKVALPSSVQVRFLAREPDTSLAASFHMAAKSTSGDVIVFLANDTVLSGGWVPPLMRTFREHADVGLVAAKILRDGGVLQSAGAVVCADGSLLNIGEGEETTSHPLYNFVRSVDACPGDLFAASRVAISSAGGFDPAYETLDYACADLSFRLAEQGCRVMYQPEFAGVYAGYGPRREREGPDKSEVAPDRTRFVMRWSDRLRGQPERPVQIDRATWYFLAPSKAV